MCLSSHLCRWFCVLTLVATLAVLWTQSAVARTRIALVIGNSAYQEMGILPNATNDAALIATTLRDLNFEVMVSTDLDQNEMKRAIKIFGRRLEEASPDSVGLFYYAGHGIQMDGANFLIPVQADIERESDIVIEAVNLDWVLAQMEFAANDLNFLIIDACRNNPVVRSFRSGIRGLAQVDAPQGTLIAYATEPGGVAADGVGENSPYTLALAKNMQLPGFAAEEVFRHVRVEVIEATNQRQIPWEASSLTGAFYFNEDAGDVDETVAGASLAADKSSNTVETGNKQEHDTGTDSKSIEVAYWESIEHDDDPALFDAYLRKYPTGEFRDLAAIRRDQLNRQRKLPAYLDEVEILPLESTLYVQKRANLRGHPSVDAELLTTADVGLPVRVTGEVVDRDWYRIALAGDRQAFIWKPLLGEHKPVTAADAPLRSEASSMNVAATAAHISAPKSAPDKLTGQWQGEYRCQDDLVGFSVDIAELTDHQLSAVFEFFPISGSPSVPRGSYAMSGQLTPDEGQVKLWATDWIDRPVGIQQHDLEGWLDDDGETMSGHILTVGCAEFVLSRD